MEPQACFSEDYKFVSMCVHCGNPMGSMSISKYESVGAGRVEERDIYQVWIDPEHECNYLTITAKKPESAL